MGTVGAGDLFRILRRTYDLSRQVEYWDGAPKALKDQARATNVVLLRGPLERRRGIMPLKRPIKKTHVAGNSTLLRNLSHFSAIS